MSFVSRLSICLGSLLALSASLTAAIDTAFFEEYCIKCHGPEEQKGDLRFDGLTGTITNVDEFDLWLNIMDQLELGEMPPKKESQPASRAVLAMLDSIESAVTQAESSPLLASAREQTALRRLNAFEYRQTLGDLLGLNTNAADPTDQFPAEVKAHGFDNNAEALVTSGLLLDQLLLAAERAIDQATQFEPAPETRSYVQKSPFYFEGKDATDLPKLFRIDRFRYIPEVPYTDLVGRHYRGGHIGFRPFVEAGAPASGVYTIRIRAAAVDRSHSYHKAIDDFPNGDPLVMEVLAVNREGSVESTGNISSQRSLAVVELTDPEPQWFEWDVYLERGEEPEVKFANATLAAKRLSRLLLVHREGYPEFDHIDIEDNGGRSNEALKVYRGPKLRIWEVQVAGPHVDTWPPKGHTLLYGDLQPSELDRANITTRLRTFARAAFRRPLRDAELTPIENLVTAKLDAGVSPLDALQLGFQAILCSPGFMYLDEGDGALSDYALATRLSLFLWSSQPDAELQKLARDAKLRDPAILQSQIERLLDDPKSDRFVENFVRLWLGLDNIGVMPPSPDFTAYYRDNLQTAMRQESEAFFDHLLTQNLPPREFITADYTFLNRELARHYGLPEIAGSNLRRVTVNDPTRGGLLGQGALLTASANGVDTSPVIRGIYVAERILGYTPSPPPPDVPAVEPDIRGATTIRELLAKHRADPKCAECHRNIDPFGFALENFDAVGGWREKYGPHQTIDASGELASGETYHGPAEFRTLLAGRETQLLRALTNKLLTYATGREMTTHDRPEVERIVKEIEAHDQGLRDLVGHVVQSDIFQHR